MTTHLAPPAATEGHELHVLTGPQQGAVLRLLPDRSYSVCAGFSAGFSADIVLRPSPECAGGSATITLRPDGLLVQSQAGELMVAGTALAVGESRLLPWSAPWQLGGITLAAIATAAVGAGAREAARTGALAGAAATAPGSATVRPAVPDAPLPAPARLRGWGRRLATAGGTVVVASLSMWALAMAIAPTAPRPDALAQRAQATLHAAGMTAVTVAVPAGQGDPVVEGYLDTHAQRTRAEGLLAAQGLRPRFAVWINENLAQAVHDVYRVHGISAEVQTLGPGRVRVSTALADPSALPPVEKVVRRDVHGLNQLDTRNAPPPGMPSPVPNLDDPGKRVASIVASDEPYVATQDGTRYFIGALLPTGHRILAIADGRVELEREGLNTALTF